MINTGKRLNIQNNEAGAATIEAIPLLAVFIIIMSYGIGSWGVIDTSILNSIAARNYAFETFRNRTNLKYFRENKQAAAGAVEHTEFRGMRYHGVASENNLEDLTTSYPTTRKIALGNVGKPVDAGMNVHKNQVHNNVRKGIRNTSIEVNPTWLMIGYGICLNAACGD